MWLLAPKVHPVWNGWYFVNFVFCFLGKLIWITAFTAGGKRDTEMATPTSEPTFSAKIAIAAAAPVGNAVQTPTRSAWNWHLHNKIK